MSQSQLKKLYMGAKAVGVTVIGSLFYAFIVWLFSVETRIVANENSIKNTTEVLIEVKQDTSSILCKMGETSECNKVKK